MRLLHFPPFLLLLGLGPAFVAYWFMDRDTRPPLPIYGIRWFLGLVFAISGLAKLIPGFPNTMGPVNLEGTLAPHGLALFARFVAVCEVGTGLLLLTRRFATLGAVMLLPMLLSILVVTVSLQWRGTPYVVTGFILLDLVLLLYDAPKLAPLLGERPRPIPSAPRLSLRSHAAWLAGLGASMLGLEAIRFPAASGGWSLLVVAVLGLLIAADWRSARSRGQPGG